MYQGIVPYFALRALGLFLALLFVSGFSVWSLHSLEAEQNVIAGSHLPRLQASYRLTVNAMALSELSILLAEAESESERQTLMGRFASRSHIMGIAIDELARLELDREALSSVRSVRDELVRGGDELGRTIEGILTGAPDAARLVARKRNLALRQQEIAAQLTNLVASLASEAESRLEAQSRQAAAAGHRFKIVLGLCVAAGFAWLAWVYRAFRRRIISRLLALRQAIVAWRTTGRAAPMPEGRDELAEIGQQLSMLFRLVEQRTGELRAEVAERQTAQARLAESERDLRAALCAQQQAMREQRNFLSMVGHEFRTPLSIIAAASDVVELSLAPGDERAAHELAKIRRAVMRLVGLIETCLADEWLDSSMDGLARPQPVALGPLLADLLDERRSIASQSLALDAPPEPLAVEGAPSLLRVLFANLIDNAIKYAPPASAIRVRLEKAGGRALVSVADQGPGIAPAEAEAVFEKFYRSPAAMNQSGAGLGLHLVRRIAERHKGTVSLSSGSLSSGSLSSGQGRGAVFTVSLPLAGGEVSGAATREEPCPIPA